MKMKLRPITLALLGTGIGRETVKFVESISGSVRAVKILTGFRSTGVSVLRHGIAKEIKKRWENLATSKSAVPFHRWNHRKMHFCAGVPFLE
jgi:hypothetical protein